MEDNPSVEEQPQHILDVMKQLLSRNDITDYEQSVPHMLVELYYRHVSHVLELAQKSAVACGHDEINIIDAKNATRFLNEKECINQTHERIIEQMIHMNDEPLQKAKDYPEVIDPPPECSLLETNFQIAEMTQMRPTAQTPRMP